MSDILRRLSGFVHAYSPLRRRGPRADGGAGDENTPASVHTVVSPAPSRLNIRSPEPYLEPTWYSPEHFEVAPMTPVPGAFPLQTTISRVAPVTPSTAPSHFIQRTVAAALANAHAASLSARNSRASAVASSTTHASKFASTSTLATSSTAHTSAANVSSSSTSRARPTHETERVGSQSSQSSKRSRQEYEYNTSASNERDSKRRCDSPPSKNTVHKRKLSNEEAATNDPNTYSPKRVRLLQSEGTDGAPNGTRNTAQSSEQEEAANSQYVQNDKNNPSDEQQSGHKTATSTHNTYRNTYHNSHDQEFSNDATTAATTAAAAASRNGMSAKKFGKQPKRAGLAQDMPSDNIYIDADADADADDADADADADDADADADADAANTSARARAHARHAHLSSSAGEEYHHLSASYGNKYNLSAPHNQQSSHDAVVPTSPVTTKLHTSNGQQSTSDSAAPITYTSNTPMSANKQPVSHASNPHPGQQYTDESPHTFNYKGLKHPLVVKPGEELLTPRRNLTPWVKRVIENNADKIQHYTIPKSMKTARTASTPVAEKTLEDDSSLGKSPSLPLALTNNNNKFKPPTMLQKKEWMDELLLNPPSHEYLQERITATRHIAHDATDEEYAYRRAEARFHFDFFKLYQIRAQEELDEAERKEQAQRVKAEHNAYLTYTLDRPHNEPFIDWGDRSWTKEEVIRWADAECRKKIRAIDQERDDADADMRRLAQLAHAINLIEHVDVPSAVVRLQPPEPPSDTIHHLTDLADDYLVDPSTAHRHAYGGMDTGPPAAVVYDVDYDDDDNGSMYDTYTTSSDRNNPYQPSPSRYDGFGDDHLYQQSPPPQLDDYDDDQVYIADQNVRDTTERGFSARLPASEQPERYAQRSTSPLISPCPTDLIDPELLGTPSPDLPEPIDPGLVRPTPPNLSERIEDLAAELFQETPFDRLTDYEKRFYTPGGYASYIPSTLPGQSKWPVMKQFVDENGRKYTLKDTTREYIFQDDVTDAQGLNDINGHDVDDANEDHDTEVPHDMADNVDKGDAAEHDAAGIDVADPHTLNGNGRQESPDLHLDEFFDEEAHYTAEQTQKLAEARKILQVFISTLPPHWEDKVTETLKTTVMTKVIAKTTKGIEITRNDIAKIIPGDGYYSDDPDYWLNDEIVNGFFANFVAALNNKAGWTKSRDKNAPGAPYATLDSHWYEHAVNDIRLIERWSRLPAIQGERILHTEAIFLPINDGNHWTLVIVSGKRRTIEYLDSLDTGKSEKYRKSTDFIATVREWLKMELGEQYKKDEWTELDRRSSMQTNGQDCGVFTCLNGLVYGLGIHGPAKKELASHQIPAARRAMIAMFVNGGFKDDFAI